MESTTSERHAETFPQSSTIHFEFAARGDQPPVKLTWYDGRVKPPADQVGGTKELEDEGLLFIGDKGMILCGFSGNNPRLIPAPKDAAPAAPRRRGQRGGGGQRAWLGACKGGKVKPGANFEFSAVVTEALQLGNISVRTGERLSWDHEAGRITNASGMEQYVRPERRAGWEV